MTMDILLDLNIVVDLLVPERKGHLDALKINNIIKTKGYTKWISASSIDNLEYIRMIRKSQNSQRCSEFMEVKINTMFSI